MGPFPEDFTSWIILDNVQDEGYQKFEHSPFFSSALFQNTTLLHRPEVQGREGAPHSAACRNPNPPWTFQLVLLLELLIDLWLVEVKALCQVYAAKLETLTAAGSGEPTLWGAEHLPAINLITLQKIPKTSLGSKCHHAQESQSGLEDLP